jgi:hypothetical protein
MVDLISSKTALTVGSSIFNTLKGAYQSRQLKRVESFFKCVESRYEFMSEAERLKLNETLDSEDGKNILASYVDAITQTSCDRIRMAVALLYCQDSDFSFNEADQRTFISGVVGISDHLVDFFLEAVKQVPVPGNYPYSRHIFQQCALSDIGVDNLDGEIVYAYTNDLVRRGLLLPEPAVGVLGEKDNWFIGYGTSQKIQKIARLIDKSNELLRQ